MFNLDQAISEWRRKMAASRIGTIEVLDELESHLRDDVEQQLRAGLTAEKAFAFAVQQLGDPNVLRGEFERVGETPDSVTWTRRITVMERDIMLPVKAMLILVLLYSFYTSNWLIAVASPEDLVVESTQVAVWFYAALNLLVAGLFVVSRRLPMAWLQLAAFTMSLTDGLFLSLLCLVTGGYNSILYWVFLGLIVRNSVSIPGIARKVLLDLCVIICYALVAIFDLGVIRILRSTERSVLELYAKPDVEQVLVRVILLVLTAACCFLIESMLNRQRFPPPTRRLA